MKAEIITLLISTVPVLELRAAIPYGVVAGLSILESTVISILGNMIPVPFLVLFTRRAFNYMRMKSECLNHFVLKMEEKAGKNKKIVERYKFAGLIILVAIPFPGTGAWTGSLVAAMMDMRLKRAVPAIFIGVIIAGFIISWLTYGVKVIS